MQAIRKPKPSHPGSLNGPTHPLLALLAAILLCAGAGGCGSKSGRISTKTYPDANVAATSRTPSTPSTTADHIGGYLKSDGDADEDDKRKHIAPAESDDTLFLETYGKKVDRTDQRTVTALVKRYYAAAAAADGTATCSMLDSSLIAGLAQGQSQTAPGASASCAVIATSLLKQRHTRLAADDAGSMIVIQVRARGNLGLAVVGFKTTPISEILLKHEQGTWKIGALFDSEMR